MCLIVFAWKLLPCVPLMVAANRDEYYERPSAAAAWWEDHPQIYAGRDLQSGGTWLGIRSPQREAGPATKFAAVTNVREPAGQRADARSRGELVADFLSSDMSAQDYIASLRPHMNDYNGFNLLLNDGEEMRWFSNRNTDHARNGQALPPGIYGVSNAALDTCWHKVVKTKAEFGSLICQLAPEDAFFEMLGNTTEAPDCRLPDTGVSFEVERMLSAPCIVSPDYGTRVSTLLKMYPDHPAEFHEKLLR